MGPVRQFAAVNRIISLKYEPRCTLLNSTALCCTDYDSLEKLQNFTIYTNFSKNLALLHLMKDQNEISTL